MLARAIAARSVGRIADETRVVEIWSDCEEDDDTVGDDCEVAHCFPGFWPYVIANFGDILVALGFLGWLMVAVSDLRKARAERFAVWEQAKQTPRPDGPSGRRPCSRP